jgi:hypothetical protein
VRLHSRAPYFDCGLRLTLSCKLIDPEPVGPDSTLADRIRSRGDNVNAFAIRLSSEEKVSPYFREPRAGQVQVMVEVLPASKPVLCPVSCTTLIKTPSTRFVHFNFLFSDYLHYFPSPPLTRR